MYTKTWEIQDVMITFYTYLTCTRTL